jgi:phosphoglycolate phosphatase
MLRIANCTLDPRLVLLDKDGTLISFHALWQAWFEGVYRSLRDDPGLDEPLAQALADTLGYDRQTGAWDPLGPLTLAATTEVGVLIAGALYRHRGLPWDAAMEAVHRAEERARRELDREALLEPIGDVRDKLVALKELGLKLAVVTTDTRAATEWGLGRLGLLPLLDALLCADDGVALKPAPDMALEICRRLGVAPAEAIMVGDTVVDMVMAKRAGLACAVGVTSGALDEASLRPHADVVIADIHAIEVLP